MATVARNLQACHGCRKAKVKCSGVRPRCNVCIRRQRHCRWPETLVNGSYKAIRFEEPSPAASPIERPRGPSLHEREYPRTECAGDISPALIQRLVENFSRTPHVVEFCGSMPLDMLRKDSLNGEEQFLLQSVIALSAFYFNDAEIKSASRFATSQDMVNQHLSKAQISSRHFSDRPTLNIIYANLILGLCELLTATSTKAWLHIGLAIRLAQALRMRRENNGRHSPRQREVRRRLFWACLALDRLVAYCTFRTQTIDQKIVELHLPCSETSFAFEHERPGPWTDELLAGSGGPDSSSLALAYFVKTLTLWSPIAQCYVELGRRRLSPDQYWTADSAMKAWINSLPSEMQWSDRNLRAHSSLGQLWHFVDMHLLAWHALFLVHHEYLTHREDQVLSVDLLTLPTGTTSVGHTSTQACISGVAKVIGILRMIHGVTDLNSTPNIFAGMAMVTSASVLLWVVHCSPHLFVPPEIQLGDRESAKQDVHYLLAVLDSWSATWPVAGAWAQSIRLLDEFYRTTYGPGPADTALDGQASQPGTAPSPSLNESRAPSPGFLRDGDGLPDASTVPSGTYYKVRLITGLVSEQPELCRRYLSVRDREAPDLLDYASALWENAFEFSQIEDTMADALMWTDLSIV